MFQRVRTNGRKSTTLVQQEHHEKKPASPSACCDNNDDDKADTMSTVSVDGDGSIESDARYLTAPRGFLCPLTMEVMLDPVLDAEGNTYERAAVLEWLQQHRTSPISRQPLSERMLIPNNSLRESIHEFMGSAWVNRKTAEHNQSHPTTRPGYPPLHGRAARLANSSFREKINCFLQLASSEQLPGLPSELNAQGCCAFRHDGITMALDVPETVGVFCLYTRSLVPELTEPMKDLLLELNFLQCKYTTKTLIERVKQPESGFSHFLNVSSFPTTQPIRVVDAFPSSATMLVKPKSCFPTRIAWPKSRRVILGISF